MKLHKPTLILFLLFPLQVLAGNTDVRGEWYAEMNLMGAGRRAMPFWSYTNKGGILPSSPGAAVNAGASSAFFNANDFRFSAGLAVAGYYSAETEAYMPLRTAKKSGFRGFLPEAYVSAGWRNLNLDLGIKRRAMDFGGALHNRRRFDVHRQFNEFPGI